MEEVRATYAAQLAICELRGADSLILPHCDLDVQNVVVPPMEPRKHRLKECLKSLESKAQWWTSYSNSKQNAIVLCQAARIEIERGLQPHLNL